MNKRQESARRKIGNVPRASAWRQLYVLVSLLGPLVAGPEICAAAEEKAAAKMRDVEAHFKDCLQPFHEADGSQITVYFSVRRNGQIYGRPRAVWFGPNPSDQDKKTILSDFVQAFESCTPLQLEHRLAEAIPGKVYYLQFKGGQDGSDVIVRPYGSEGPPLVGDDNW
jgi:hypothetical protein